MRLLVVAAAAWWLLLATTVHADRDDTYYPAGVHNPLVQNDLYYKDASNVLEDLGAFESLFVEYHSCTWSASTGSDEDNEVQQEGNENEDFWYMGAVPLRQANVAFSLYGVKKREGGTYNSKNSGCSAATFINSFVTTASFRVFTDSLATAGVDAFNQQQDDDEEDGADAYDVCSDDGYGVGCSSSGTFVYNLYSQNANGDYICDKNHVANMFDEMEEWNAIIETTSCFEIYNAQIAYAANDDGGDGNNDEDDGLPIQNLLTYSQDCNVNNPEITCPDPHGVLRRYEKAFSRGAYPESAAAVMRRRHRKAWSLVALSMMFLLASFLTILDEVKYQRSRQNRTDRLARELDIVQQSSTSSDHSSNATVTTSSSESGGEPEPVPVHAKPASPPKPSRWSRFRLGRGKRGKKKLPETELTGLKCYEPVKPVQRQPEMTTMALVKSAPLPANGAPLVKPSSEFEPKKSTKEPTKEALEIEFTSNRSSPLSPFATTQATATANEAFRAVLSEETSSLVSVTSKKSAATEKEDQSEPKTVFSGFPSLYQAAANGIFSVGEIPTLLQAASIGSMEADSEAPSSVMKATSFGMQSINEAASIGGEVAQVGAGIAGVELSKVADAVVGPLSAGIGSVAEAGMNGIGTVASITGAVATGAATIGTAAATTCGTNLKAYVCDVAEHGYAEVIHRDIESAAEKFDRTPCAVVMDECLGNEYETVPSVSFDNSSIAGTYAQSMRSYPNREEPKSRQRSAMEDKWRKRVDQINELAEVKETKPQRKKANVCDEARALCGDSGILWNKNERQEDKTDSDVSYTSHSSSHDGIEVRGIQGILGESSPETSPESSERTDGDDDDVLIQESSLHDSLLKQHSVTSMHDDNTCADQSIEVEHDPKNSTPFWRNPLKRNKDKYSSVVITSANRMSAPRKTAFTEAQRGAERERVQRHIHRIRSIAGLEQSPINEGKEKSVVHSPDERTEKSVVHSPKEDTEKSLVHSVNYNAREHSAPSRPAASEKPRYEAGLIGPPKTERSSGVGIQAYLKMRQGTDSVKSPALQEPYRPAGSFSSGKPSSSDPKSSSLIQESPESAVKAEPQQANPLQKLKSGASSKLNDRTEGRSLQKVPSGSRASPATESQLEPSVHSRTSLKPSAAVESKSAVPTPSNKDGLVSTDQSQQLGAGEPRSADIQSVASVKSGKSKGAPVSPVKKLLLSMEKEQNRASRPDSESSAKASLHAVESTSVASQTRSAPTKPCATDTPAPNDAQQDTKSEASTLSEKRTRAKLPLVKNRLLFMTKELEGTDSMEQQVPMPSGGEGQVSEEGEETILEESDDESAKNDFIQSGGEDQGLEETVLEESGESDDPTDEKDLARSCHQQQDSEEGEETILEESETSCEDTVERDIAQQGFEEGEETIRVENDGDTLHKDLSQNGGKELCPPEGDETTSLTESDGSNKYAGSHRTQENIEAEGEEVVLVDSEHQEKAYFGIKRLMAPKVRSVSIDDISCGRSLRSTSVSLASRASRRKAATTREDHSQAGSKRSLKSGSTKLSAKIKTEATAENSTVSISKLSQDSAKSSRKIGVESPVLDEQGSQRRVAERVGAALSSSVKSTVSVKGGSKTMDKIHTDLFPKASSSASHDARASISIQSKSPPLGSDVSISEQSKVSTTSKKSNSDALNKLSPSPECASIKDKTDISISKHSKASRYSWKGDANNDKTASVEGASRDGSSSKTSMKNGEATSVSESVASKEGCGAEASISKQSTVSSKSRKSNAGVSISMRSKLSTKSWTDLAAKNQSFTTGGSVKDGVSEGGDAEASMSKQSLRSVTSGTKSAASMKFLGSRTAAANRDDVSVSKQSRASAKSRNGTTEDSTLGKSIASAKSWNEGTAEKQSSNIGEKEDAAISIPEQPVTTMEGEDEVASENQTLATAKSCSHIDVASVSQWSGWSRASAKIPKSKSSVKSWNEDTTATRSLMVESLVDPSLSTEKRSLASSLFGKRSTKKMQEIALHESPSVEEKEDSKSRSQKFESASKCMVALPHPNSILESEKSDEHFQGTAVKVDCKSGHHQTEIIDSAETDIVILPHPNNNLKSERSDEQCQQTTRDAKVDQPLEAKDESCAGRSSSNAIPEIKEKLPVGLLAYIRIRDERLSGAQNASPAQEEVISVDVNPPTDENKTLCSTEKVENDDKRSHQSSSIDSVGRIDSSAGPGTRSTVSVAPDDSSDHVSQNIVVDPEEAVDDNTKPAFTNRMLRFALKSLRKGSARARNFEKQSIREVAVEKEIVEEEPIEDTIEEETIEGNEPASKSIAFSSDEPLVQVDDISRQIEVAGRRSVKSNDEPSDQEDDGLQTKQTVEDKEQEKTSANDEAHEQEGNSTISNGDLVVLAQASNGSTTGNNEIAPTEQMEPKELHRVLRMSDKRSPISSVPPSEDSLAIVDVGTVHSEAKSEAISHARSDKSRNSRGSRSVVRRDIQFLDASKCDDGVEIVERGSNPQKTTIANEVKRILAGFDGDSQQGSPPDEEASAPAIEMNEDTFPDPDQISLSTSAADSKIGRHIQVKAHVPSSASIDGELTDSGSEASMTRASKSTVRRLNEFATLHTTPVERSRAVRSTLVEMGGSKEQAAEAINLEGHNKKQNNLRKKKWLRNYAKQAR